MTSLPITGYANHFSVQPGDLLDVMVSCSAATYEAEVVRLIHGDTRPDGPGFKVARIESGIEGERPGREQAIHAGSYVRIDDPDALLDLRGSFTLHTSVCPTTPGGSSQGLVTRWSDAAGRGFALVLDGHGHLALWLGDGERRVAVTGPWALASGVWYAVAAAYDAEEGSVTLYQRQVVNSVNSRVGLAGALSEPASVSHPVDVRPEGTGATTLLAAYGGSDAPVVGHFNGKLDSPYVYPRALTKGEVDALAGGGRPDGALAAWDFAANITRDGVSSSRVVDVSGRGLHGTCVNMPARGMTGWKWSGDDDRFVHAPEQYGAIHFHDDDLEDAAWEVDFSWEVPTALASDVYAVHLRCAGGEDYVPFFVRRPTGQPEAPILFLAPTASYMAYGNNHQAVDIDVAQLILGHSLVLEDADIFLDEHREYGLSCYDVHSDGSGVCYSSRLRPILNMRPRYRSFISGSLWQFNADLHLIDWLNAQGFSYDVATDEDLHREGLELLRHYAVVVTGSHPEYYSKPMLDGLEQYVGGGGRLMYLGGNGFYWVISYDPEKPHVLEVRRAEGGSRAWQARSGEYYHSTTGELGGLWRNRGRPPQKIVGTGFSAEGFDVSSHFRRASDGFDPRVAFILEGVEDDELIGDFGLVGGGAAGVELDRYDLALGTPPNAFLLASSENHTDEYLGVVEEVLFNFNGHGGTENPLVRGDLVYFTNPSGGAVFAASSIAWCGSLSHNNYDNNVSRITGNVLRAFARAGALPDSDAVAEVG